MPRETINSLQAGRAIAALAVVLVHSTSATSAAAAGMPDWLRWIGGYGWLGVDFFFVLSGFIMAYSHRQLAGGGLGAYARGRLARVMIPYLPVGIAVAALATLIAIQGVSDQWTWPASATLIPGSGPPALDVAWTLQFELAFYAVFGLSLAIGRPFSGVASWVVVAILYNLLFDAPPARLNPWLNPIIVEFLFGMAAAEIVSSKHLRKPVVPAVLSFLLYVAVGAGTEARAIFALSMAFTVVALVRAERSGTLRVPNFLVILGAASYSIYLVHSPLVGLGAALSDRWWLSLCGAVAISVAAGLSYHFAWEAPMLRWVRRRSSQVTGQPGLPSLADSAVSPAG